MNRRSFFFTAFLPFLKKQDGKKAPDKLPNGRLIVIKLDGKILARAMHEASQSMRKLEGDLRALRGKTGVSQQALERLHWAAEQLNSETEARHQALC